jgi:hypothetical protein
MYIDLRGVNAHTIKDRHPLPRIEDLLTDVRVERVFTTIDLKSAYNCVLAHPAYRPQTTFYCGQGMRHFKRLAMGLANEPSWFQRFMERVLGPLRDPEHTDDSPTCPFARSFSEDVIIYSRTWAEHKRHVGLVLDALRAAGLTVCADMCFRGRTPVLYLGHVVTGDGTRPNPKLCSAVQDFPRPITVQQVRSLLGMCSFFRSYMPRFADLAAPLNSLTHHSRKGTPIAAAWSEAHEASFEALRAALVSTPCL